MNKTLTQQICELNHTIIKLEDKIQDLEIENLKLRTKNGDLEIDNKMLKADILRLKNK